MATILITASLVVPLFSASLDGTDEPEYKYYVSGYVITGDGEGNTPLEDVKIEIRYLNEVPAETNDKGYFKVGLNENTNIEIGFFKEGYTLRSCPAVTAQKNSEYYSLDLTKLEFDTQTSTYNLTPDSLQYAFMLKSTGSLKGTVTYEGGNVQGADVIITSTTHTDPTTSPAVYRTVTNSDGTYSISNCITGGYQVTVICNGFRTSTQNTITISDEIATQDVVLIENNVNIYFGIDLAHVLMAIGVIIGIVLVALAWTVIKRLKQNQDGIPIVLDDLEDTDDDEFKYRP